MTPLILAFAAALQAQYVPPPYVPYVQPSPYVQPAYRGRLPAWVPPTLPPGSPSLMIPMPAYPPPPPLQRLP